MVILTILIFPVHEHGIAFHVFVLSSVSFTSVLQFSKYKYFTSLVRFIPKYFILLDAIINGILFLISFFFDSLLLFRNITGFYILILSSKLYCIPLFYIWWHFQDFPCIVLCHLQIASVLVLFQFGFLLFLSNCCDQNFQCYTE